jgi:hypothetical protein
VAKGHRNLFNGLDLSGWKTDKGAWKAGGGVLKAAGVADLTTEESFDVLELIFDWKTTAKIETPQAVGSVRGNPIMVTSLKPGSWQRQTIQRIKVEKALEPAPIIFKPLGGVEIMNVFIRERKEK